MSRWLEQELSSAKVCTEARFKLDLCANEAVTNIIEYAYSDLGSHRIDLKLSLNNAEVSLEIQDDGEPFNPLDFKPRAQPKTLEDATPGGLGVKLIRHYMDNCSYVREGGINCLTMTCRR